MVGSFASMNRKVSCQGEDVDVVWATLNWTDWLATFLHSPCRYGVIVFELCKLCWKNSHIQGGFSSLNYPTFLIFFVRGEFSCWTLTWTDGKTFWMWLETSISPDKDIHPRKRRFSPLKNDDWKTIFLPLYIINGSFVRGYANIRGGGGT